MRLSDAIRRGCGMYPVQAFGIMFSLHEDGACAWGAAVGVMGVVETWPAPLASFSLSDAKCPEHCHAAERDSHIPLKNIIFHLNDDHHWTREAIADWVESIEMQRRMR